MSTRTDNKRIAKNTLILYIRMLFTMAIGLYTSRIILNKLGITDYGIYNVVGGIVTMFGFITGSMATASSRFITFELGKGNKEKLKKVFAQSVSIHLLIAIIIIILGETIGLWFIYEKVQIPNERFYAALFVYHFSVAATFLSIMSIPYNSVIVAHEKMSAFAYITIIDAILKLIIVFILDLFQYDKLIMYAFLFFIVQAIIQIIYILYSFNRFPETHSFFLWDKKLFKEMSYFAGWSLFGNLAGTLFNQGLNILLNIFFGPTINAARGIAVQVQGLMTKFISSFQTALNPQITKRYASGNLLDMHNLIYTSSKYSFFLMLFLSLPILVNSDYVLTLWLNQLPDYTVIFVRIMLMISLIDTLSNPLIVSAMATGKIKLYQQVVGGVLLAILPISYISLKCGAPAYSVFIVHLMCAIVAQIGRLYIICPMINLSIKNYIKNVVLKVVYVFTISVLISFLICGYHINMNFVDFTIDSLKCILVSVLSIYFIGLNKSEKSFFRKKITCFINKSR